MSFYFPPDIEFERKASAKIRKLLSDQTFMERWEPVSFELKWVIGGRPDAEHHQKILPDYCYNILELYRRTLFKTFSPFPEAIIIKDPARAAKCKTIEEAKQVMTVDWDRLGSVFAAGERSLNFFDNEAERKIKEDGLHNLTKKQIEDVFKLFIGERWLEKKISEIQAQEPGKSIEEIIEARFSAIEKRIKQAVPNWHQKAGEWAPEAVTKFHAGVSKGSEGFLNNNGDLKGEKKLKLAKTYELLLIAWPEIWQMLKSKPPKTRNYLWEWLKPFSYAMWIEIQDLEQLNRLCQEIKLKLKKPGAPSKSK